MLTCSNGCNPATARLFLTDEYRTKSLQSCTIMITNTKIGLSSHHITRDPPISSMSFVVSTVFDNFPSTERCKEGQGRPKRFVSATIVSISRTVQQHTTGRVQHMAVRPVVWHESSKAATVARSDSAGCVVLARHDCSQGWQRLIRTHGQSR